MDTDTRFEALEREVARLAKDLDSLRQERARGYLTTKELAERWGVSTRTLQSWRSDPTNALEFDVDRLPTHKTAGKFYSRQLVERIERSWRAG